MWWWYLSAALAAGVTGCLGYVCGHYTGVRQVSDRLRNDPSVRRVLLEELAKREGAKLQIVDVPGPAAMPEGA